MIQEAYCSYEISKLLKEKGFDDEECTHYYSYEDDELIEYTNGAYPTHQMAMAWLREKHHIHANPIRQGNYDDCSDYYTWIVARNGIIHRNQSIADKLSYEDAVEAALKYVLENLL